MKWPTNNIYKLRGSPANSLKLNPFIFLNLTHYVIINTSTLWEFKLLKITNKNYVYNFQNFI
ncbi:hypothetical protein JCM31447_30290 [Fluviispira sanaruensis]|uniref:Uncharacterized protein n=1 Tax=Fluviispira sanaruensis TaxID=2493639 RepID=A0A4P2VNQ9_FLUSA|nr:hypothetical protein JCM31447_30290 [Fluviispira sanaruensis]